MLLSQRQKETAPQFLLCECKHSQHASNEGGNVNSDLWKNTKHSNQRCLNH